MSLSAIFLSLMLVTSYTEVGTTASGLPSGPGVAACPPDMPFGTHLWVEGYGDAWCLDSYAPRLSRRVDVWSPTVAQAYAMTGQKKVWLLTTDANND